MATLLRIYCKPQSGILSLKSLLNIQSSVKTMSTRNYWPTYENKRKECHDKEEESDRLGHQRKSTTSQEMTP